ALGDQIAFWKDRRIESVAEHTLSTVALARTFLNPLGSGAESYDRARVIDMLLCHDLAEAWVGDRIGGEVDQEVEAETLWKYGAFATYRGVSNLWRIPELFAEFAHQYTIDARVARDLDRAQFILQARAYKDGMSANELEQCEKAEGRLTTETVREI